MKQGDLVKYKEPYSKLAYLRKEAWELLWKQPKKNLVSIS